jgi:hypothetical protein
VYIPDGSPDSDRNFPDLAYIFDVVICPPPELTIVAENSVAIPVIGAAVARQAVFPVINRVTNKVIILNSILFIVPLLLENRIV